jgi:peptidyl-prolyl cis-trans isomerase C
MLEAIKKLLVIFLLALFWATAARAQGNEVVARVGTKSITKGEFEQLLKLRGGKAPIDTNTEIAFLNNLVQTIALGDLAREKGLDKRKDVQELIALTDNTLLANLLIKEEVLDRVTVTEEQAKKYYETHRDQFKGPEQVKIRQIVIEVEKSDPEEEKNMARLKAEEILKKIRAGEDFAKLASTYSDDQESKAKGGDLGFVEKGNMYKPLDEAAFKLNPGEVSGIIETPAGFHIIKMDERRQETLPYERVKDKAMARASEEIKKEKVKEFLTQVFKQKEIKIFPEVLEGQK